MYPIYQYQSFLSQPSQNIQYVNNRQSVDAYPMSPSSSVILMDQNLPRFYIKQTDASGSAVIKSYDFKETEEEKPEEYVTKSEFEKFKASVKGAKHESSNDVRERPKQHDDASHGRDDAR